MAQASILPRVPAYCLHRTKGLAYVRVRRRVHYLGRHGSPESLRRYEELIAGLRAAGVVGRGPRGVGSEGAAGPLVGELVVDYFRSLRPTLARSTKLEMRAALSTLAELSASVPAAEFGPSLFKGYKRALVDAGLCRATINKRLGIVRRMFRWAVAEELVDASVMAGIAAVGGVRCGEARDTDPVRPVDDGLVEATLPFLPRVVADMVRVQRLTGMRPGEVCTLTRGQIDVAAGGGAWIYRPTRHKGSWRGGSARPRLVAIGPRAQAVLLPYMARHPEAPIFSVGAAPRARAEVREADRMARIDGPREGGRRLAYTQSSYRLAVHRGCRRAFPVFLCWSGETAARWRDEHRWSPNQLRHSRATELRRTMGLETAGAVLGHSKLETTQVYAERDMRLAVEAAQRTG